MCFFFNQSGAEHHRTENAGSCMIDMACPDSYVYLGTVVNCSGRGLCKCYTSLKLSQIEKNHQHRVAVRDSVFKFECIYSSFMVLDSQMLYSSNASVRKVSFFSTFAWKRIFV